jgi:hypothetical protein
MWNTEGLDRVFDRRATTEGGLERLLTSCRWQEVVQFSIEAETGGVQIVPSSAFISFEDETVPQSSSGLASPVAAGGAETASIDR